MISRHRSDIPFFQHRFIRFIYHEGVLPFQRVPVPVSLPQAYGYTVFDIQVLRKGLIIIMQQTGQAMDPVFRLKVPFPLIVCRCPG